MYKSNKLLAKLYFYIKVYKKVQKRGKLKGGGNTYFKVYKIKNYIFPKIVKDNKSNSCNILLNCNLLAILGSTHHLLYIYMWYIKIEAKKCLVSFINSYKHIY